MKKYYFKSKSYDGVNKKINKIILVFKQCKDGTFMVIGDKGVHTLKAMGDRAEACKILNRVYGYKIKQTDPYSLQRKDIRLIELP